MLIQAYFRDTACLIPDYCNKASIAIKQVTVFLLEGGGGGLTFNL